MNSQPRRHGDRLLRTRTQHSARAARLLGNPPSDFRPNPEKTRSCVRSVTSRGTRVKCRLSPELCSLSLVPLSAARARELSADGRNRQRRLRQGWLLRVAQNALLSVTSPPLACVIACPNTPHVRFHQGFPQRNSRQLLTVMRALGKLSIAPFLPLKIP